MNRQKKTKQKGRLVNKDKVVPALLCLRAVNKFAKKKRYRIKKNLYRMMGNSQILGNNIVANIENFLCLNIFAKEILKVLQSL